MRHWTLSIATLALVSLTTASPAQEYQAGSIKISASSPRLAPKGAAAAGGFMTITTTGKEADTLIGGSVEIAKHFEVHEMKVVDGVMKMRALDPGLVIKPGETVTLMPGSYHTMFIGLTGTPNVGGTVKGTLVFAKAGKVETAYKVAPIGARGPGGGSGSGAGSGSGTGKGH